ncbi:M55 family metallopeptidase [Staphylothermus hellenicus]|uniref:Peptidase M55 D-aminopeptidase n=1 Tax=Staphylothermus hellenicus (strain DSM 12710 / JCM 10830 / BK20S6-10-b1 / P8) TaxID=591019 RepID=D7D8E9_STAHD|nr:M55 family metallopeptidase [Staphylothermus hellenicus]ADI32045.1 peptidase M55 D-aminopeptidase [Staphylothermus hellenicus DSM 12710]
MKAYVSIDIEGLPGIASTTMVSPGYTQYSRGSKIMTMIAKETARALLNNGFDKVVIADSHGYMTNIDYLELPRNTSLIQGFPRPYSMLTGLDNSYDSVLFIGYHTAAGTMHGFLDHTMSSRVFAEIRLNGRRASEYLINALVAGEKGVPVILVAGDSLLRDEVSKHTPWAVFIGLKQGITRYAAIYESFDDVLDKLREGIVEAINRLRSGEVKPLVLDKPYTVEIMLRDELVGDVLETWDILERIDAYRFRYEASNAHRVLAIIELIAFIGYGVYALRERLR